MSPVPTFSLLERLPLGLLLRVFDYLQKSDLLALRATDPVLHNIFCFNRDNLFKEIYILEEDLLIKRIHFASSPRHIKGGLEGVAGLVEYVLF
jgi:hypothetical protein